MLRAIRGSAAPPRWPAECPRCCRATPGSSPPGGSVVVGTLQLQATSLAGVFAALLGLIAVAHRRVRAPLSPARRAAPRLYLAVYNLALLAAWPCSPPANVVTFLVAWESMALLCYLLILRHPRRSEVAAGAFWFLALSETGFVLIVAAFVILAAKTHSMQLEPRSPPGRTWSRRRWRDAAYLLALTGFGFKAGLVPLHVWLPEAHPVAPADGSAFLSGLIVKLGVYGIALFAFRLLPAGPAWRGHAHHGRRGGHRGHRHPLRAQRAGHQALPRLLHDREHRHHRHRVRRRDDLPGLRPAAPCGRSCCWPGSTTWPTTAPTRRCCSWRPG